MRGASKTSGQMTLPGTDSATSSPGSGAGPSRSASRGGPTTARSGPDRAPVSPSAITGAAGGSTTAATSGPRGSASSASVDLGRSLGSKLRAALDSRGSTLYSTTWKVRVTPAGRSISALRGSVLRTSASDFTSWPTPRAADGAKNVRTLAGAQAEARRKGWNNDLSVAVMATWATPTARDHKSDRGRQTNAELYGSKGKPLPRQALSAASGATPISSGAEMKDTGQLNPEHSRWLMGLPTEWDACAPPATRSSRKSPRR